MKKKFSRSKLLKWLKSAAGITLLSISLGNNVSTVVTNSTSPQFVAQAMEQRLDSFPKGTYVVKYERSTEDEQDSIPYSKTVLAIAYDANLAQGGKIINLSTMMEEIGGFEYIVSSAKDTSSYNLTSIFVKQPENPLELEELLCTLKRHASFVTVEDASGYISSTNSFINGQKST
ncbi:hypothetical protein BEL05_10650 [Shewanella colwelliana]|uniref:Uncharacterized protein n=1 Tax=Shewanella colwelliana TaxID=23 RepID=A0A1E5IQC2_SHECO|nr:hypothetical protein [Shewanella colwelliana]OEG72726.1 hypothetical protein BEL05_10650 [Shewanella colwelliana]